MNDLDLIRDLGPELDPEPTMPPPRMRARFLTAIAHPQRSGGTTARHRVPWQVAAAAATAALVAFGVVRSQAPEPPGTQPDTVVEVELTGRQLLLAAASSARSQTEQTPDPDAFVYTREHRRDLVFRGPRITWPWQSAEPRWMYEEYEEEWWWSVDGTGGVLSSSAGGPAMTQMVVEACRERQQRCPRDPGYVTDLPTDPDKLLEYLSRDPMTGEQGEPRDGMVIQNAWLLLNHRMVPPEIRAAIFEALAELPQHDVTTGVETATGDLGTAVGYTWDGTDGDIRDELVFDPETNDLIGWRWVNVSGDKKRGIPPESVRFNVAVVEQAVVPEMRLRPDGSRNTTDINASSNIEGTGQIEKASEIGP
jgi:hypothetical protein